MSQLYRKSVFRYFFLFVFPLKTQSDGIRCFPKTQLWFFTPVIISHLLLNANSVIILVQTYTLSFNISVLTVILYKSLQKGVGCTLFSEEFPT